MPSLLPTSLRGRVLLFNLAGLLLLLLACCLGNPDDGRRAMRAAGDRAALLAVASIVTDLMLSAWLLGQRHFGLATVCGLFMLLYAALGYFTLLGSY